MHRVVHQLRKETQDKEKKNSATTFVLTIRYNYITSSVHLHTCQVFCFFRLS